MMAATFCVGSLAATLSRFYVAKMSALTIVSWEGGKKQFISGQYLIRRGCLLLQYCILLLVGALSSLLADCFPLASVTPLLRQAG